MTPLSYALTLDVDPESETFRGDVRIRVRLDKPTDRVWLHMVDIDIRSARYNNNQPLEPLGIAGDQMRAFSFGRTLAVGELELAFSYVGHATKDQQGLFRQRAGSRWYLFSQGQAIFARRITPCFDEPRFKTPWRVTLVVPRDQIALANEREERVVIDGKVKRVAFAQTRPMASYLLAIAVGPFDVVESGTVGRNHVRVRVAVRAGAGKATGIVTDKLPAIVGALERYMDDALPLSKLDLVGVPHLFGAMENPGLITFDESMLIGVAQRTSFVTTFVTVAAHELVHQWFGNSVTPAWWDDLWLSEAFAAWLGDKVAGELRAVDNPAWQHARARHDAASEPNPTALRRSIANNTEADANFDYAKGEIVLATIEAWLGADRFRDALRTFVRAHRDGIATTDDFVAAFSDPDARLAVHQYATIPGLPVVDLELRCTGKPALVAAARDGRAVPICFRYALTPTCTLIKQRTELPLPSCPSSLLGNPAAGYYHVAWKSSARGPAPVLATLDPTARTVIADDIAAAVTRGELAAKPALAELRAFIDAREELGALAIARAIDRFVDDATRPAWTRWLATRFARRLTSGPQRRSDFELYSELLELLPPDQFPAARRKSASQRVDRLLARDAVPAFDEVALAATTNGDTLFARILDKARATQDPTRRADWLELLGAFPAPYAERVAALAIDLPELPIDAIWSALESYFARASTRTAAWQALRTRLDTFRNRVPLAAAVAQLCDHRDEIAKSFSTAGPEQLGPGGSSLGAIDRCIAGRAHLGDLAAAIAASP